MMLRGCLAAALAFSFLVSPNAASAQSRVSPYGKATAAYAVKDYKEAESQLTELIETNSTDPRVYYFRGLTRYALGRTDEARPDFEEGARLEALGASRVNVSRALERIQGPARRTLEKSRSEAKRAASLNANSDRRTKTLYAMYTQARTAYFRGDLAKSQTLLDEVVKQDSKDPRVYYFRGLTLQGLGRTDEAEADFDKAVALEVTPDSRIDVDHALERVQGAARRTLESRREEKLAVVRAEQRQRRRELIAQIAKRQGNSTGLIATSVLPNTSTTAPTVASTTPGTTTSGTVTPGTTNPPTTVKPPASGDAIDLAYLPTNTAFLVRVNVREIWQSPLVRQYADEDTVTQALAQMKQMTGLGPADIESITAGTTDIMDEVMAGPAGAAAGTADDDLVVVIRTRLPFDTTPLKNLPMFESASHGGTDYFKPTQEAAEAEDLPSVFKADSKIVVLAMEPALQKAIDQGADFNARPEFNFLDTSKQIVIGFVPPNAAALTAGIPDPAQSPSGSPSLDKLAAAGKGKLMGLSFGVGVTDSIELGFGFLCEDQATSDAMNTAFAGLLDEGKGLLDLAKAGLPPQVGGLADSLLRSVKSTSRSATFSFSARITQQTINRAIVAAEEMGPALLMGLAGGGGPGIGGPGFGPQKPIEPPKATAQAQNLQIASSAKISSTVEFDFDTNKELPRAIELLVDITGDQAKKASGFGFVTLTSARDENGTDLKLRKQQIDPFGGDGFEAIDREDFFVEHPDEGCRVTVKIEPPANAPTKVASAEGTVKLRIIDNATEVSVDNAASFLGKAVTSDDLAKEGYALKLEESEEKFGDITVKQWKLTWTNAPGDQKVLEEHGSGGGKGLQSPQLVDADGNVVYTFDGKEYGGGGFSWSMAIQEDTPIPPGAKFRFTVNKAVSIVDVPFKVMDVTIGKADF